MHNSNLSSIICWSILGRCLFFVQESVYGEINEDIELSTVELIKKTGYPIEIYSNIATEDGYLLDIYRIPYGKQENKKGSRNPALLMHGLLGTSRDFVLMGPERGLAYLLADRNYDVWLGNTRGTAYSRKHVKLNPNLDADFWNFSWHEIGLYDLPTIFQLIRYVTKQERLSYIGMSQGTTVFYVLTSLRPEYNHNVTVMISLAPVAYMTHTYSPIIRMIAAFEPILVPLAKSIGLFEISPQPIAQLLEIANKVLCTADGLFQTLCANILFVIGGYDPLQLNTTILPVFFGIDRTASILQFFHYLQNTNSGLFQRFNFGREINLEKYGSPLPPSYNLTKITAPIALFYSDGDWLASTLDVERLFKEVSNCVYKYKVPFKDFSHFDFLVANDVVNLVYKEVFYTLDKYNNKMN